MAITLTYLQEQLRPHLDALNEIIVSTLNSNSELTNNIVTTYLKNKGKLLRPIVTLLSAQFFGGINDKALQGAAALEMLHNASLIHDDVIDEATERRGEPTINSVWSNHVAVLVGDFFVTGALRCGVATGDGRILSALADMGRDLSSSCAAMPACWASVSRSRTIPLITLTIPSSASPRATTCARAR